MLQIIAMITMLIDHIGAIKDITVFRIIGRLSMPIYAWFLSYAIQHTKDIKQYKKRLLIIAIISQFTFMGLFYERYGIYFNMCFTWYICANTIYFVHNNKSKYRFLWAFLSAVALIVIPCDYGIYALFWCLLWYLMENKIFYEGIPLLILIIVYSCGIGDIIQLFSLAAVPVVHICTKHDKIYLPKKYRYIWRVFYPAHMGVLRCLQ